MASSSKLNPEMFEKPKRGRPPKAVTNARKSSRLTAGEIDEIIDLIPERLKPGVLSGDLVVRPQHMWYSEDKPVIVGAHDNHIKYGRYITANDPGLTSKMTAYKRKRGYKEMQNMYIGAEPGDHELQIISLKEIIESLWNAANGSPQTVYCKNCGKEAIVAFKKDPNALFKLYENIVGKATETTDINVNQNTLIKLLQDNTPLTNLTVIDLPPQEVYERRKLLEAPSDEEK